MDWFHSTYTNRIDKKGRISVPADFRAVLAKRGSGRVVMFPSIYYPAIEGAAEDYLAELNQRVEALPDFSQERDDMIDSIMPYIEQLSCDTEGRVVLPEALIAHAGLHDQATFIGRGKSFQVWQPDALRQRQAEARARVQAQRPRLVERP